MNLKKPHNLSKMLRNENEKLFLFKSFVLSLLILYHRKC